MGARDVDLVTIGDVPGLLEGIHRVGELLTGALADLRHEEDVGGRGVPELPEGLDRGVQPGIRVAHRVPERVGRRLGEDVFPVPRPGLDGGALPLVEPELRNVLEHPLGDITVGGDDPGGEAEPAPDLFA